MSANACRSVEPMTKNQPPRPAAPESPEPAEWGLSAFEAKALRGVLGQYPTGVAIVTTRLADGQGVGLTINSFASLSLSPPMVLWSLVDTSPSLTAFSECSHFAISILARQHQDLALRFARPAPDKFAGAPIIDTPEGMPAIAGALATLVCRPEQRVVAGDHVLFIGRVVRVHRLDAAPLVFHAGQFTSLLGND